MGLIVEQAIRLVQKDLVRLTETHLVQVVSMYGVNQTVEDVEAVIESGKGDDEGDVFGLLYFRLVDDADASRAFEGWFLDLARFPETSFSLEGGMFYAAGTTELAGVEMSQSSWHDAKGAAAQELLAAAKTFEKAGRVKVKGPALKTNPPFALVKAPPGVLPDPEPGVLDLEVASARRYTVPELKAAEPFTRFQAFKSWERSREYPSNADLAWLEQSYDAFPNFYSFIDPGCPQAVSKGDVARHRFGFFHVQFRSADGREFDGWFYDMRRDESARYWPDTAASATDGKIFERGTVKFTGVTVSSGRIKVDRKKGLPVGTALAAGLKRLGLKFTVELGRQPEPGEAGYFGSENHALQLR